MNFQMRRFAAIALVLMAMSVLVFQNCGQGFKASDLASIGFKSDSDLIIIDDVAPCAVENGIGEEILQQSNTPALCRVVSCNIGYKNENNSCIPSASSCPILNGNGTIQADGSCRVSSCSADYHLAENRCDTDKKVCQVANGTGEQLWDGVNYGACRATSCNAGYELKVDSCNAIAQSPNTPGVPVIPDLLPERMSFSFIREQPIRLQFQPSRAFPANTKVTLKVAKISSNDALNAALYARNALKLNSELTVNIAKDSTLAVLDIPIDTWPLQGKTTFELSTSSTDGTFPKFISISVEPEPDDIIDVQNTEIFEDQATACLALTYSGKLFMKESLNMAAGNSNCLPGVKVGGAGWSLLNSAPDSIVQKMVPIRHYHRVLFSELLKDGSKILTTYGEELRYGNKSSEKERYELKLPFAWFTRTYHALGAIHTDTTKFSVGLTKSTVNKPYFRGLKRVFGEIVYNSPVGELSKLGLTARGLHYVAALDKTGKAHLLESTDLSKPNGYRIKQTFALGSPVIDLQTTHTLFLMLTKAGRIYIYTTYNDKIDAIPTIIELPVTETKQPVSFKVNTDRLSVLYTDGSAGDYFIHWHGSSSAGVEQGKIPWVYYGKSSARNFFIYSKQSAYNQVTNTFITPTYTK